MKPGLDMLCMGHKLWPVQDSIANTPAGTPIGCFDKLADDALPNSYQNAFKHIRTGKFPQLRVHVWYGQDKKCVPIEILKKRAPMWNHMAADFPGLQLYLSHSCEYQFATAADVKERIDIIKALAPRCIPVQNPVSGAPTVRGVLTERHTATANVKADITSNDGFSSADIDVQTYLKNNGKSRICFLWMPRYNLREVYEKGDSAPPVAQRTAIPSPGYLRTVARLLTEQGKAPKPTFGFKVVPFKKPLLYKVFAEDKKGEADPRACKPLTITNSKAPVLDIVTYTGKKIGEFGYFGTYFGGTYRHYSGWRGINLYGADIGTKAFRQSGSEFVWFVDPVAKVAYGPVNPSYRRNWFQEPK